MLTQLRRFAWVPILALGLFLMLAVQQLVGCHKKKITTPGTIDTDVVMQAVVKQHELIITTPDTTEKLYVPESGQARIQFYRNKTWDYKIKTHGLTRRFGGGVVYADKLRFSLDLQMGYWNRFGFHGGLGFASTPVVRPFVAVSYRLDAINLTNTSVMLGVAPGTKKLLKEIVYGIRVEF